MTHLARISVLAILTLAAVQATARQTRAACCEPSGSSFVMRDAPLTKSYKIQPGFCPRQLVYMIPKAVPGDVCAVGCGPYGIPPIYAAGNYVLVRQTTEGQAQVAKFLTDLGAYVPPKSVD